MRATSQEQKGGAGAHEVAAKFERLGWGVAFNPDHDLGTDLYLTPRDERLVELTLMAGAQVKAGQAASGGKYFRRPKRDKNGAIIGWWYHEPTRRHFDYWVNHKVPHLLVLHDLDTQISYWVHVAHERVRYLKKGAKIFVPADQTIDEGHGRALLEATSEQREGDRWEGSSWAGASDLSPTHLYRHALLVPRLVAPHPNRSVAQLSAAEALSLLILGRDPTSQRERTAVSLVNVAPSAPWEWHLAAGMRRYIRKADLDGLTAALREAVEPHQQAASAATLAAAQFEVDDIAGAAATLDAVLERDEVETVDHAWLSLHRARVHYEAGEVDRARQESLRLIGLSAQVPHDVTASAISGAAANLLFAAADWDSIDFAKTVAAADTTVSWWRQQVLGWGRGQRVQDEFKRWAHDTRSQYRSTDAWDLTRAASLIAGLLGDHGAWRHAMNELAQHMLIVSSTDDAGVIERALGMLRGAGAHLEIAQASDWLIAAGPFEPVKRVADRVHPASATISTLHADLALLTAAGDLLEQSHAESLADWGTRAFGDPAGLSGLRPQFDVDSSIADLLASLTTVLPVEKQQSLLRWAITARSEHPAIVARSLREVIVNVADDAWDLGIAELATAAAGEHESAVRYALLRGARRHLEEAHEILVAEAREGRSADALWALGNVRDFSHDLVITLRDQAIASLQGSKLNGVRRGHPEDMLSVLNVCHPHHAVWEPVLAWLESADADTDAARVLELLFRRIDDLDDELVDRLKPIARNLQDVPASDQLRRRIYPDFRTPATALAIAVEHRTTGTLAMAPVARLAAGDRNARQFAAMLCAKANVETIGFLAALAADPDPYVRATNATVLVHRIAHGEGQRIDLLKTSLEDRGAAVVRLAASQFADHATSELMPVFEPMASHASGAVRRDVRQGLAAARMNC